MQTVSPTTVIDLREVTCAACREPLGIAAYDYNGDPSALRCHECARAGAASTAVGGVATTVGTSMAGVEVGTG